VSAGHFELEVLIKYLGAFSAGYNLSLVWGVNLYQENKQKSAREVMARERIVDVNRTGVFITPH
jgi:hypothetical protein